MRRQDAQTGEKVARVRVVFGYRSEILRSRNVDRVVVLLRGGHAVLFTSVQAQSRRDFGTIPGIEIERSVMVDGFVELAHRVFEVGELLQGLHVPQPIGVGIVPEGFGGISESRFAVAEHFVRERRLVVRHDRADARKRVFGGRTGDGCSGFEGVDSSGRKFAELRDDTQEERRVLRIVEIRTGKPFGG